jgi:transcription antitermination factor NusG
MTTPGVTSLVGSGRVASPVSDQEIEGIQLMVAGGFLPEPWPFVRSGQRVRIKRGALAGIEGILVERKSSWRVVLNVELLRRAVAVEVDLACITPVSDSAHVGDRRRSGQPFYACYQA